MPEQLQRLSRIIGRLAIMLFVLVAVKWVTYTSSLNWIPAASFDFACVLVSWLTRIAGPLVGALRKQDAPRVSVLARRTTIDCVRWLLTAAVLFKWTGGFYSPSSLIIIDIVISGLWIWMLLAGIRVWFAKWRHNHFPDGKHPGWLLTIGGVFLPAFALSIVWVMQMISAQEVQLVSPRAQFVQDVCYAVVAWANNLSFLRTHREWLRKVAREHLHHHQGPHHRPANEVQDREEQDRARRA